MIPPPGPAGVGQATARDEAVATDGPSGTGSTQDGATDVSVINSNVMSLNAQRNLTMSQGALSQSIQRLSSGLRVNSARDDAAGLAIANRMDAQTRGMNVAIRNANDGISMAQVAEGALGKIGDMLQRMRELAVQAANSTNGGADRANLDAEFRALKDEITRTVASTKFNGTAVLGEDAMSGFRFQVGAGTDDAEDAITVTGLDLTDGNDGDITAPDPYDDDVEAEGSQLAWLVGATDDDAFLINGDDATAATAAIDQIDLALDEVNGQRAMWGATQNRFEAVISNLQVGVENLQAARSRIMDADFARETAALTRAQILQQAGTAMLAQANAAPQGVLALLRG
jgi:flagellin